MSIQKKFLWHSWSWEQVFKGNYIFLFNYLFFPGGWGILLRSMSQKLGIWTPFLAHGMGIWLNENSNCLMSGGLPGGGCWSFQLTGTLMRANHLQSAVYFLHWPVPIQGFHSQANSQGKLHFFKSGKVGKFLHSWSKTVKSHGILPSGWHPLSFVRFFLVNKAILC